MSFLSPATPKLAPWKVLLVDDEPDIHDVTKLTLNRFRLDGRALTFVHAYSGAEAKEVLAREQDIAPIGYYENFDVRGFSLNSASSYKINGRTITGEQNVGLENKQQVEVLKGLAGLQSGVSEPGGLVNYVTKRPENVHSVTVSTTDQGGSYLATDLGGWFGSEQQLGIRTNLAHEDIHSYVGHADGKRDFASLALDWNIDPNSTLQLNAEYQRRQHVHAQPAAGSALVYQKPAEP